MKILFVGDIYGRPGRQALKKALPKLKATHEPDMVIVNGENSAGGKGITQKIVDEFFRLGVDVITGGNHSLYQKGCDELHDDETNLLRPINFPPGTPGHGTALYHSDAGFPVGVINVCGRTFMQHFDDPFRAVENALEELDQSTKIIFVDFHAETTSEKVAMGWYLEGRVTAVVGTHTHIPTADETILPGGTAYITDAGMTGPYHSVIGANKENVIQAMTTLRHRRFDVAEAMDVRLCGALIELDPLSGQATGITRIMHHLGDLTG
jgi:2',3'-cyclic-nucleotide 2'-phosphodiesterase